MGWKSTIDITRKQAIQAIMESASETPYDWMTNEQLEKLMEKLGIGEDINKPYYGYNFIVNDDKE